MIIMYRNLIKRALDFTIALSILILLLPFFFVLAIIIKLDSKGPVFFSQERVGKDLRHLLIFKFRTMTNEKREVGTSPTIGRSKGVTNVGYYLRRFKIDELPQLVSVLKGDMSLIGPRPSIPSHLNQMTQIEKMRYSVSPGLTGLAQVSGNIHISWSDRYQKDLEYIRNISFLNDLKIIIRTAQIIVIGEAYFVKKPLRFERD
tara:strand:+ start:186 stop:794 length:609 start_codon:yes stop_codon:yes gene_type:complete